MTVAPEVRRLEPREASLWREIRLEALATAPEAFCSRHADWVDRPLEDFAARIETAAVHVALVDGEVVGCAVLSPDDNRKRGWIESLYVKPSARGRGIADALLSALVAEARDKGLRELMLDVARANTAARRLYIRRAFTELADRPPGSNAACEITMRLGLP